MLSFEVMEGGGRPWKLILAVPQLVLPRLLGDGTATAAPRAPHAADPAAAPFAEVPLPLTATLVEMNLPLALLSLTLVPALVALCVRGRVAEHENAVIAAAIMAQGERIDPKEIIKVAETELSYAAATLGREQSDWVQKIKEAADTLRDEGHAVPWFFRILRRAIADHHARAPASASPTAGC